LLYAVTLLAAVLVLWLAGEWRRARRIRHGGKAELVRCTACGALNEPGRAVDL
jgi:hypothetical protein